MPIAPFYRPRFHFTPRCRVRFLHWAIAIFLPATCLLAAPPPTTGLAVPAPTARSVFQEQIAALEADLAALLQRKPDIAGPELAMVDFQIDVRLIERWMLAGAVDAKPESDELNACVALRVITLQSAGAQITQRLQNSGTALTPAQLDGMAKIHQLTFKLPEIPNPAAIDDICQTAAHAMILAAKPTPTEAKSLPLMRPQPFTGPPAPTPPAPRTLAELTARARQVQVGAALKRELLALTSFAAALGADSKAQDDAKLAYDMVCAAVEVCDGLEKSTGVDAAARPKVEQQLIEGIALYSDARTRKSGKLRIAALSQYRATLLRVQNLRLPPALQQKLAPTFVWVNSNPEAGGKVLDSIEAYLQICNRNDSHKSPANLALNLKKAIDAFQKQFAMHRAGFLDDAADLGGAGVLTANPASLPAHIDSMRQALESIDVIERLPRAVQVLTLYHPKPGGALDKRVALAVADLSAPPGAGSPEAATKYLADVERLAQLAEKATLPPGLSPDTQKTYTRGRMELIESHRLALISGLATQVATGKDMDVSDLAKLETLRDMFESLRLANDVEIGLTKADLLARWADWSISAAQLKALVVPCREATAAAFEGFAVDNATPLFRWADVHKRYVPILILVKEVGLYADQCTDLPTGLFGEMSKLLTPLDNAPFAAERNASLSVGVWQRAAEGADPKTSEMVFDAMLGRLRKDLGISAE